MIGPPHDIVQKLTQREVILTLKEPVSKLEHVHLNMQTDFALIFQIPSSETLGEFIADLPVDVRNVKDLRIREGNLEDAFQTILGNNHVI